MKGRKTSSEQERSVFYQPAWGEAWVHADWTGDPGHYTVPWKGATSLAVLDVRPTRSDSDVTEPRWYHVFLRCGQCFKRNVAPTQGGDARVNASLPPPPPPPLPSPSPKRVKAQLRGIPLQNLVAWVKVHLDDSGDLHQNMHAFNDRIIKPVCEKNGCSVAEYLKISQNVDVGEVDVFANHSWDSRVQSTMLSFEGVFKAREWPKSLRIWMCSFALHQMKVKEELGDRIEKSPFALVLRNMHGRNLKRFIVLVDTDCGLFSRAWCLFEEMKAIDYEMDLILATPEGDIGTGSVPPRFLKQIMDIVRHLDVKNAQCSSDADLKMIKKEIDEKVRGGFDGMTRALKARFRKGVEAAREVLDDCTGEGLLTINQEDLSVNFSRENLLGKGSFCAVYRACYHNQNVAAKVFDLFAVANPKQREELIASARKEFKFLQKVRHPNVVYSFGLVEETDVSLLVVMEMCKTTLHVRLIAEGVGNEQTQVEVIPADICKRYLFEIAAGLAFIHSKKVLHGDMKSMNVLIDDKDVMKIADFGLSSTTGTFASFSTSGGMKGSYPWSPPERVLDLCAATTKSDTYSFGCIIYEVVMRCTPWENLDIAQIVAKICTGCSLLDHKRLHPILSTPEYQDLVRLIRDCLQREQSRRPEMKTLVGEFADWDCLT